MRREVYVNIINLIMVDLDLYEVDCFMQRRYSLPRYRRRTSVRLVVQVWGFILA